MTAKLLFVLAAISGVWLGRTVAATRADLEVAVVAFLGAQGALALFSIWWLRGDSQTIPESLPPAIAIIPVSGVFPGMEDCARSMLAQRYPGDLRVVYVIAAADDPARQALEPLGAEFWVAGEGNKKAGGLLVSLSYGLGRVPEDRELVLFTTADAGVEESFAASLATEAMKPGVSVAAGAGVPYSRDFSLWGSLFLAWFAGGFPGLLIFPVPWGGAMMARRNLLIESGLAERWSKALSDDGTIARMESLGPGVRLIRGAIVRHHAPMSASALFEQLHRWLILARVYVPRLWVLGGIAILGKTALFGSLFFPKPAFDWITGFLVADSLFFAVVAAGLSLRVGGSLWTGVSAGLVSPLLWVVYGAQFARSAIDDVVSWGPKRYRIRGPEDVELLS